MKIGFFSHYFSPEIGAPSARIHDLARNWLNEGHDVKVVTCFPNHPEGKIYFGYKRKTCELELIDGIEVYRNWTYITPNKGIIKKTIGHITFWISSRLFSSKKLSDVNVVIGTSPTLFAAMAARGLARARKVPFVIEVRDLWPGIFIDLGVITNKLIIRLLETWELWLYKEAQQIITVTEGFRDNIVERGIDKNKVFVVPNGADINYWHPQKSDTGLSRKLELEDKFVVLYLGAHGISQGLESILQSAKELKSNPDICFLFVGDGSDKQKLIDIAEQEKLKNVIFHAPVSKELVKDFYSLAEVCLVPLRNIELFNTFIPSKMFEILAMEKPIIASLSGEAKAILEESGGAIITSPEDSKSISQEILKLYNEPDKRKQMGQAGRLFVEKNYSRKKLAADYIRYLQGIVDND